MTWLVMFCWASFCRPDPAEPRAFDSLEACREVVYHQDEASLDCVQVKLEIGWGP
jgi:hypothetical protein